MVEDMTSYIFHHVITQLTIQMNSSYFITVFALMMSTFTLTHSLLPPTIDSFPQLKSSISAKSIVLLVFGSLLGLYLFKVMFSWIIFWVAAYFDQRAFKKKLARDLITNEMCSVQQQQIVRAVTTV